MTIGIRRENAFPKGEGFGWREPEQQYEGGRLTGWVGRPPIVIFRCLSALAAGDPVAGGDFHQRRDDTPAVLADRGAAGTEFALVL